MKRLNLNLEGLIDMIEKYDYDWPEAEDDNLDELLKKSQRTK